MILLLTWPELVWGWELETKGASCDISWYIYGTVYFVINIL